MMDLYDLVFNTICEDRMKTRAYNILVKNGIDTLETLATFDGDFSEFKKCGIKTKNMLDMLKRKAYREFIEKDAVETALDKSLKRCPFCGGRAEIRLKIEEGSTLNAYVQCSACFCKTTKAFVEIGENPTDLDFLKGAFHLWNRRT